MEKKPYLALAAAAAIIVLLMCVPDFSTPASSSSSQNVELLTKKERDTLMNDLAKATNAFEEKNKKYEKKKPSDPFSIKKAAATAHIVHKKNSAKNGMELARLMKKLSSAEGSIEEGSKRLREDKIAPKKKAARAKPVKKATASKPEKKKAAKAAAPKKKESDADAMREAMKLERALFHHSFSPSRRSSEVKRRPAASSGSLNKIEAQKLSRDLAKAQHVWMQRFQTEQKRMRNRSHKQEREKKAREAPHVNFSDKDSEIVDRILENKIKRAAGLIKAPQPKVAKEAKKPTFIFSKKSVLELKKIIPNMSDIKEPAVLLKMRKENHGHLNLANFERRNGGNPMSKLPSFSVSKLEKEISVTEKRANDNNHLITPKKMTQNDMKKVASKITKAVLSHLKKDEEISAHQK